MQEAIIKFINVNKIFTENNIKISILNNFNFSVNCGESVSIVGPSGCGKTTVLCIAGLISHPDSGKLIFAGQNCEKLGQGELTILRRQIGFVYQFHHLLAEFTVLENLIIPQIITKSDNYKEAENNAMTCLEKFNLQHLAHKKPANMSGGENQRIAILRAFVHKPRLVLADEPTGNLDIKNSEILFNFILENAAMFNVACIVATHNIILAKKTNRIYEFK